MEIRAALGKHFIGFTTGRWDYINSVSDARAWDREFVSPNIDAITQRDEESGGHSVHCPSRSGVLTARRTRSS